MEEQGAGGDHIKKFRINFYAILLAILMLIITCVTVSAKKLGDDLSWGGFPLGWILLAIAIIIGILVLLAHAYGGLDKKVAVVIGVIMLVMGIGGLMMVSVDIAVEGQVSAVSWEVEINSASGSNISYDDDAGSITCLCHVNSTAGTILDDTDSTYQNPLVNWSISPSSSAGITDLDKGVTSTVSVPNPDYQYTEDGSDYYLIAQTSGGKREVNFTNDGVSEYEEKSVTVQYGSTEYVELYIDWYDTGVATLEAGESKEISVDICGTSYTVKLIVTGVIT